MGFFHAIGHSRGTRNSRPFRKTEDPKSWMSKFTGEFVPMVSLEHPDALENLHKDFQHAGSDVVEAFTYNAPLHYHPHLFQ